MKTVFRKYFVSFLSVYFINQTKLGLIMADTWENYFFSAFVLFIILLIKPVIDALLFPVNLITMNMTNWITFIFFIYLWSVITPDVKFVSFNFSGFKFGPIDIGSLFINYWSSVVFTSLAIIFFIKFLTWIIK